VRYTAAQSLGRHRALALDGTGGGRREDDAQAIGDQRAGKGDLDRVAGRLLGGRAERPRGRVVPIERRRRRVAQGVEALVGGQAVAWVGRRHRLNAEGVDGVRLRVRSGHERCAGDCDASNRGGECDKTCHMCGCLQTAAGFIKRRVSGIFPLCV
jgi:hypothetical protein